MRKPYLLALGLSLVAGPQVQAGVSLSLIANARGGDGLFAQLVYLPAGFILAAVVLEVIARRKGSKPLHEGVLGVLLAAVVCVIAALGVSIAVPAKSAMLSGSAFATGGIGAGVAAATCLAALMKWLHLRASSAVLAASASSGAAKKPKPKAKSKRRARGRGGRRRGSRAHSASAGLASITGAIYPLSLAVATAGALFAGPILNRATTGGQTDLAGEPTAPAAEPEPVAPVAEPVEPTEPTPTVADPLVAVVEPVEPRPEPEPLVSEPDPVANPQPETTIPVEPEPEMVANVDPVIEPEVVTPEPETDPAPTATESRLPTAAVRPVTTEKGGLAGADTYNKLIQPVLRSRCYSCHGEEKQKGDLRLDTPEGIRLGGKSGPIIIAGKPEKSYLFELINLDESDDDIMPPKGKPLTGAQISWIGGWIREGAALGDGAEWPLAEGGNNTGLAIDALTEGVAKADGNTVQQLLDSGVIVRELSSDGKLLEIDFSHADRAAGELKLGELGPIAANIHTLDLKRTKITDDDLKALSEMANLRILHLQRTKITDSAIPHLVGLKQLESLNLYNTQVSDAALPELKKMTSLKKIYLWSTQVTADGARDLASVLGSDVVNMGE